jgi:hypothetical protein
MSGLHADPRNPQLGFLIRVINSKKKNQVKTSLILFGIFSFAAILDRCSGVTRKSG